MNKGLTPGQIKLIHRFTNNMTILYDGDSAGIKASLRGIDMLLEEGMNIKVCLLPDGEDPDSFARQHNATEFQAFIKEHETDFIRFKTNLLMEDAGKDPIKRAELIGSIVQSISVIPEAIVRDVYIKECAQLLHVEDRLLVSEVAKRREQQAESKAAQAERERQRAQRQAEQQALDTNGEPLPPPPTEMEAALPDGELPPPVLDDELVAGSQPLPPPPGYLPSANKVNDELLKYERLILRMIIRYGEQILFQDDEQQNVTVIGYIDSELRNDELTFSTPLHQQILNEAIAQQANNGFKAERYFLMHENPTVSQFAGNLISERYQLSKYHSKGQKIIGDEERLGELIPHLVINYKYAIVGEELKKMLQQLQDPSIINDAEKCNDLMNRYSELRQTQNLMAKHLGDRVVIKA